MLSITLKTSKEFRQELAARAKDRRLALNISQQELAERSGVSLGSIKRFEHSGLISLSSLLEIALVFDCLDDFDALFAAKGEPLSLFAPAPKKRKRSSRKSLCVNTQSHCVNAQSHCVNTQKGKDITDNDLIQAASTVDIPSSFVTTAIQQTEHALTLFETLKAKHRLLR